MTIIRVTGWTLTPNGQLNLCGFSQAKQFRVCKHLIRTIWVISAIIGV